MSRSPDLRAEASKAFRLVTAPLRVLPSFVIPGSPKCGTSTLYHWLTLHPNVRRGMRKEPTNFIHYPGSRLRSAMNYPLAAGKMLWGNFIVGDGSVEYFTHPDAPANVHDVLPEARLIFLFRDPVVRAWSDYQMFRSAGRESRSFEEIINRSIDWLADSRLDPLVESAARNSFNPVRYVLCGLYWRQASRWLAHFPRERCLFLISERFFACPDEEFDRVCGHLDLPPVSPPAREISRAGGYSDWMDPATEAALRTFYRPHNEELAKFLGEPLPW